MNETPKSSITKYIYPFQYVYVCDRFKDKARAIIISSKIELSDSRVDSIWSTWSTSIKHTQNSFHQSLLIIVDKEWIDHAHYLNYDESDELRDPV